MVHRWKRVLLVPGLLGAFLVPAVVTAPAAVANGAPTTDQSVAYQVDSLHDGTLNSGVEYPPLSSAWTRDLGGEVSYPIIADGRVFVTGPTVGGGSTLYALDAKTGKDVWGPIDLGGTARLTYGQGAVYSLDDNGILQAFDAKTGVVRWIVSLPNQYSFSSAPTYRNGLVFAGGAGSGGTVYAVSAADGRLLWTQPVENGDNSSPAVTDTGVYVSYACLQTYDFDPATGAPIWHYSGPCEGGGGRTPVVGAGRVWARDFVSTSLSFDADSGALAGSFAAGPPPAFDGGRGFFVDGGVLKAKDALTQNPLWSFAGDGGISSAPIVVNGYVYVGSTSGEVWALDETTGAVAWSANTGAPILADFGNFTGLAAGQGLVVVPASNLLVAYAATLHAPVQPLLPYHPLTPARILDTRSGNGAPLAKLGLGATVALQVTGRGGVPATGVSAVVLNVTVTGASSSSFLTAWPAGAARPLASNLNFNPGQTVPNLVTVKVGAGGVVDLFNNLGSTDVVADVAGWYGTDLSGSGAGYSPLAPARILDTRSGTGAPAAKVGPGGTVALQVTGHGGVPASGVSAVALNVTVTDPTATSFLTAWPAGEARPLASNLNFDPGQTVPNLVIVKVGAGGVVDLYNNLGSTNVVADVAGWYGLDGGGSGAGYVPVVPARILDTRTAPAAPLGAGATLAVQVDGIGGVPSTGVAAVVLNVTATQPSASSFLTAWPAGKAQPLASNLNFSPGQTVPNLVVVKVGASGQIDLFNNLGTTQVVVDVAGWYAA